MLTLPDMHDYIESMERKGYGLVRTSKQYREYAGWTAESALALAIIVVPFAAIIIANAK